MNTTFLLLAQYEGKAVIPIEQVCRDYFCHLTPPKLVAKISAGDIAIPLVRIENSQKCAKGVHLQDLAKYLDTRTEVARKEMIALTTPQHRHTH
ncbi:pyocin activator PrtN family protein [Asticcacaulis taihuensis]|uniref:pyocin activator PrtN family protein n=1 Tax=Asticcacaulis taihuensis TaxID=260084 RepID=UPI0026EE486D|nr:pyocin activator PrtN family protein [Asticcacaulis taihuensis]